MLLSADIKGVIGWDPPAVIVKGIGREEDARDPFGPRNLGAVEGAKNSLPKPPSPPRTELSV